MKKLILAIFILTTLSWTQSKPIPYGLIWGAYGGSGGGVSIGTVMDSINTNTIPTSIDSGYALLMFSGNSDSVIQSGFRANATGDTIRAKNGTVVYPVTVGDGWTYAYTTVDTTHTTVHTLVYEIAFSLDASSLYEFEYQLYFTTNDGANATGMTTLASVSSAPTSISSIGSWALNAGGGVSLMSHDAQTSNTDSVVSLSSISNAVPMPWVQYGRVLTNSAGVMGLGFHAERVATGSTVTLKRGSYGRIRKIY